MGALLVSSKGMERIKKEIKRLERILKVKISIEGNYVSVEGEAIDEYHAEEVMKAMSAGFDSKTSLFLLNDDIMMEEIKIKDYTRHTRLKQVKARVIGSGGRALKTISSLSECYLKLMDNAIFAIGRTEDVKNLRNAMIALIKGSNHSNVYSRLEHKPDFNEEELKIIPEKKE
jgi:ribosomal RNA assembly protein